MIRSVEPRYVPAGEVERRIAEYRQRGSEGHVDPQVVYLPPHHSCPWPDCATRIAGIRFQLETMGTEAEQVRWLDAWWQGEGLTATCPGCGRLVRYGLQHKDRAQESTASAQGYLPEDWHRRAHLVLRSMP
jgi:hypothetical protein